MSVWTRARSLRSSAVLWNVAARAAGLGSAAVAAWVLARLGGATEVGFYALLRVLPATLGVLVAGGLPGAATYFLAGPSREDRRVPLTLIGIAALGGAGGGALWLAATPLLHGLFFRDMAAAPRTSAHRPCQSDRPGRRGAPSRDHPGRRRPR